MPVMRQPHNIYIHVPFCISKCKYCAFFSTARQPDWDKYCTNICNEIQQWSDKLGPVNIPTIFFGGGTPSLMPTGIFAKIITKISQCFHICPDCEITLESNPGTLDAARLDRFIAAGVNRLSVGVQSLDDGELEFLGRRHTAAEALRLINAAQARNIKLSADFIYGLPGHTTETVAKLCRGINQIGLRHCSLYELTIEPATPFGKMNLAMPSNSAMADMYATIGECLHLPRYEVSNYATADSQCRHNANIWDGMPYIGIGRGAAGRIYTDGRWFEQMGDNALFAPISDDARATEKIITGMRTMRGVKITPDVERIIDWGWVGNNPLLIQKHGDRLCATGHGILTLEHMLLQLTK